MEIISLFLVLYFTYVIVFVTMPHWLKKAGLIKVYAPAKGPSPIP
jgi:hypothetical protein